MGGVVLFLKWENAVQVICLISDLKVRVRG